MDNSRFRLKDFVVYNNALYRINTIFYGPFTLYSITGVYTDEKIYDISENQISHWNGKIVTQK